MSPQNRPKSTGTARPVEDKFANQVGRQLWRQPFIPDPSELAQQFRHLRQGRGMTQEKLSSSSGVAKSEISRFEHGWSAPTARTLERLARALEARLILKPIELGQLDPDASPPG